MSVPLTQALGLMKKSAIRCTYLALFAGFLAACARSELPDSPAWTREEIGNLRIQLVDLAHQESLWFSADGTVTAEYGTKDSMVGSVLHWRLAGNRLEVYNSDHVIESLSLISKTSDTIVARNESGKVVRYRRLALPKRS
jgi:hypothetical protein